MAYRAEIVTAVGDADRARRRYQELCPYAGQVVLSGVASTCVGAVDRYLGMLASAMGQCDLAEDHYQAALTLEAGLGSAPTSARTNHWYGKMLLGRRGPRDLGAAKDLLASCVEVSERFRDGAPHRASTGSV